MRILILNWRDLKNPRAGGAEVFTEGFARVLHQRGHSITLFTSCFPGASSEEIDDGIRKVRRGGRLSVYREARRFLRRHGNEFDVIIDEVNTRPFQAHKSTSTPTIALIHQVAREVWFYETPLPVAIIGRYLLEPWWLRQYRGRTVLTDSPSSAQSLELYGIYGATPLPIGALETPNVDENERVPKTMLFVGRMVRSKRPDHVVKAFQEVRRRHPEAKLWMVGDGPMLGRLATRNEPGVTLFGHVNRQKRNELMATASVLVMTSVREGWGLTVSEASIFNTPTIGYRSPGLVDSITASDGVLVRPEPTALANAVNSFFDGTKTISAKSHIVTWEEVADFIEYTLETTLSTPVQRDSRSK